jgi:enoyl-CoA hydratase
VGIGKAKEMIFTGDFVKADEAQRIGLVSRVVKQEALIDEAVVTMNKIVSKAPLAIKYAKIAINSSYDLDLKNGLELEKDLVGLCFATDDQSEGMSAFVEKRPATFKGR